MALHNTRLEDLSTPDQLQALGLLPKEPELETTERLDDYIGVIGIQEAPMNLYLRVDDLVNPEVRDIKFFVYTMGKKSIILWGYYDRKRKAFDLEGSCRPMLSQIGNLLRDFREWDFQLASFVYRDQTAVKDYVLLNEWLEGRERDLEQTKVDFQEAFKEPEGPERRER